MNPFSKWFGRSTTPTRLEVFLSALSPEMFQSTYQAVADPKMRVPAVVSVHALLLAGGFACGLRDMMLKVSQARSTRSAFQFDAVATEAAAFAHYWLLRSQVCTRHDRPMSASVPHKDDDYLECLRESARLTNLSLERKVGFTLDSDLMLKRCNSYWFAEDVKSEPAEDRFGRFVISSFQSGSPTVETSVSISTSLPLQLCVTTYVPIFVSTRLADLETSTHALYLAHLEGKLG